MGSYPDLVDQGNEEGQESTLAARHASNKLLAIVRLCNIPGQKDSEQSVVV